MSTRTDIHRPVDFDPASYSYVGSFDPEGNYPIGTPVGDTRSALRHLLATAGHVGGNYATKGTCDHCGARFRYTAVLRHLPTDTYIAVGETCLDNRFSLATKADFDALRKAAALDRQAQRIKTAAREFVANLPEPARTILDRETDLAATYSLEGYGLRTVTDIRNKIWNSYGNASERAVAFAVKLAEEAKPRQERAAAITAERAAEEPTDAPEGKHVVQGTVIKRSWKENEWGGGIKLVIKVKTADRKVWLCYVSEPSKSECERGDVVELTCTLTRSDRDRNFAFGKRPSKFSVLRHEELGEASALDDPDGFEAF